MPTNGPIRVTLEFEDPQVFANHALSEVLAQVAKRKSEWEEALTILRFVTNQPEGEFVCDEGSASTFDAAIAAEAVLDWVLTGNMPPTVADLLGYIDELMLDFKMHQEDKDN